MKRAVRFTMLWFMLLAAGCGYHVPAAGDAWVGQQGRTLCVELFANRTVEPYLDSIVTDEVSAQMARSRLVALVEDPAGADLVLAGTVTGFDSQAAAYDVDDNISEYSAWMTVKARLVRGKDGVVLWQEDFRRSETYAALLDKSQQQGEESLAARILAKRIAEDLLAHLLASF